MFAEWLGPLLSGAGVQQRYRPLNFSHLEVLRVRTVATDCSILSEPLLPTGLHVIFFTSAISVEDFLCLFLAKFVSWFSIKESIKSGLKNH